MAFVLARLRLALQIGGMRRSGGGIGAFVAAWSFGVVGGLVGGFCIAVLDSRGDAIGDLFVLLLFVLVFGAWVMTPIATPVPLSNLVDPTVLEQYPLTRTQQVAGLLLGGLMTPTAAATFLFAAGGVVAINIGIVDRVAALGGAALFVVLCVASSYAVRALLAEALADRRGRDIAVIVSTLLVIGMYALGHLLSPIVAAAEDAGQIVLTVLSWLPPGAAASLAYVIEAGDAIGALARVGVVLATTFAALLLWGLALRRHTRGHSARAVAARRRLTSRQLALVPAVLHRMRPGPALGAASQQLRYYFFRAPRAAQFVVLGPVVGIMFGGAQVHTAGLPFASAIAAVAIGASAMLNVFGYDGRGVELTVQTGGALSGILRGKLLAVCLFVTPTVVALTIGFAIVGGAIDQLPIAIGATVASLLLAVAVGAASSAWNPYDQEAPQGDRGDIATRMIGAFALAFALVYGTGWLSSWVAPVVPVIVVIAAALVLTAVASVVSIRVSGTYLDRHPARLLAAFTPR